jgi:hypothetical protein
MTENPLTEAEIQKRLEELDRKKFELLQKERAYNCENNCEYFIDNLVYIEDKDVAGTVVKFNMWEGQRNVIAAFIVKRLSIILKARQLGLTWLALSYAVWKMIYNAGFTVVGLSRGDNEAMEMIQRVAFILRYLPPWLIRNAKDVPKNYPGLKYEVTAHEITIYHYKKEAADFKAFAASPDSGRSFTANLVIIDEWAYQVCAEEIWTAAYPTINRPTGGQVIGLSSGKRNTWFEFVWNQAKAGINKFYPIFLNWKTDPRRDEKWYADTKSALPNTYKQEYPTTESDAFAVGQGAFFEEFSDEIHVPVNNWEPPNDRRWPVIGSYDPGFSSNACFKWYSVSPDGWARCFREYYPHRTTDSDQADEILRRSVYKDGGKMSFYYIVADTDAWTPSRDSGKSTAVIFAERGLSMRQADKDLENGWRRLHEWLRPYVGSDGKTMTALLTFTRDCGNTIRCYPAMVQSKTNPEDISRESEHHVADVDRYFCMSRPMPILEEVKQARGSFDTDNERDYRTSEELSPFN